MYKDRRGQDVTQAYIELADKTRHGLVKDFREILAWSVLKERHADNHQLLSAFASHLEEGVDSDQLAGRVENLLRGPDLSAGLLAGPDTFDFLVEARAALTGAWPKALPTRPPISMTDLADHVAAAKVSDSARTARSQRAVSA